MRPSIGVPAACLLMLGTTAAAASPGAWHFNFQQGTAEYAVGDFRDGHDNLALYCAEAGVSPGSVSVVLHRAGARPPAGTTAMFETEGGRVGIMLDADGSASWPSLASAKPFQTLWRLLASGRRLTIAYGPGAPLTFTLNGAATLLESRPCPKQLAG